MYYYHSDVSIAEFTVVKKVLMNDDFGCTGSTHIPEYAQSSTLLNSMKTK